MPVDVAGYAAAVRAHLAGLPPADREALLEDLEEHLREVAAEPGATLPERLGSPQSYASELRWAYDRDASHGGEDGWAVRASRWLDRLRRTTLPGHASEYLPELRVAWWVMRAYVLVLFAATVLEHGNDVHPVPNPFTSGGLIELAAMAVAVAVSIRLGRHGSASGRATVRAATLAANLLLALVALGVGHSMSTGSVYGYASPGGSAGEVLAQGQVTNIYPYSSDGRPLKGVLLYDQNGQPLVLPPGISPYDTAYPQAADGSPVTNDYPLTERYGDGTAVPAPSVQLPEWPRGVSPSPTPAPSPAATPSPSAKASPYPAR